jgi:hypothetical protein
MTMKYDSRNKMMAFSSDEEVARFHDQLTDIMRSAMLNIGGDGTAGEEDNLKLTQEFFARYSALAETLSKLRAHLPRGADAGLKSS